MNTWWSFVIDIHVHRCPSISIIREDKISDERPPFVTYETMISSKALDNYSQKYMQHACPPTAMKHAASASDLAGMGAPASSLAKESPKTIDEEDVVWAAKPQSILYVCSVVIGPLCCYCVREYCLADCPFFSVTECMNSFCPFGFDAHTHTYVHGNCSSIRCFVCVSSSEYFSSMCLVQMQLCQSIQLGWKHNVDNECVIACRRSLFEKCMLIFVHICLYIGSQVKCVM